MFRKCFVTSRAVFAALVLVTLQLSLAAAHATALSGRVTRAEDGTPVVGARVTTGGPFGSNVETQTDADGRYALDFTCVGTCGVSATDAGYQRHGMTYSGMQPTVTADFALVREAVIGGRVVLPAGADPLAHGPTIEWYDEATGEWSPASTALDGTLTGDTYRYGKLRAGTYRLCYEDGVHVRQCFDGQDQGATVAFDYTPVVVAVGETNTAINFSPRLGATIEGRVYDGYADAANDSLGDTAYLTIYDENGGHFPRSVIAELDASGHYRVGGFAAGNYYVVASYGAFLARVWPNGNCRHDDGDCDPLVLGTPITLPWQGATGIDFALQPHAVVRARIVDASTGNAIAGATLSGWTWVLGVAMTTRNWYDASTGEHVSYNDDDGERIGATAPDYVSRFVLGGNCAVLLDCSLNYPRLQQSRGDVRQVTLRLTRAGDYLFSNDFE